MKKKKFIYLPMIFISLGIIFLGGCATTMKMTPPNELVCPQPIQGNTGKYMCPYTQDGVLAEWTDKAINAKIGGAVGQYAGTFAGQKALEQVPFVGGFLGGKVGEQAGKAIAIKMAGGMDYIKKTSDLSFNSIDDMAVYIYVAHSNHEHYKEALSATYEIYPELKQKYYVAISKAKHKQIP